MILTVTGRLDTPSASLASPMPRMSARALNAAMRAAWEAPSPSSVASRLSLPVTHSAVTPASSVAFLRCRSRAAMTFVFVSNCEALDRMTFSDLGVYPALRYASVALPEARYSATNFA